jgi:C4-dicarboxylate-specific signal transduction histidine kinase
MFLKKFFPIVILFTVFFFCCLIYVFYNKSQEVAINNAKANLTELMMNYKAFREYVSKEQKEEIYRLQGKGVLGYDYFHPEVLSSTYGSKRINELYNKIRVENDKEPIVIKFAATNPRNPKNKATDFEAKILKMFNDDNNLTEYMTILENENGKFLFYAIPTKKTTQKCMRCHSTPDIAPKDMLKRYGDKNGFGMKLGYIRASLTTMYPLKDDLDDLNGVFHKVSIVTFFIFIILLFVVYKFMKHGDNQRKELEELNITLDNKVKQRTDELSNEKGYLKNILDTNPSIIIVTDGQRIKDANKNFFDFFGYDSLDAFYQEHECVCDYFDTLDDEVFSDDRMVDGINWCKYLAQNRDATHSVSLTNEGEVYYFNLNAIYLNTNELLLTLQDITSFKNQENIMIHQSKMASMGEMLTNIAHHWRQPLSMISTSATSVMAQKEFGMLTDEKLEKALDDINQSSQFLSTTLDDFRNFFAKDKIKQEFQIDNTIDKLLKLLDSNFSGGDVVFVVNVPNTTIVAYENELIQVLINMVNNAHDILIERDIFPKVIQINGSIEDDSFIISIHDNGGGIPDSIKEKVFEPYFTTKHQYQGTGIGLYMSYEIINQHMQGEITVGNEPLVFKNKEYMGAKFTITLPL